MGRLVLNVLLSFAQFEREIIAERTRDKVAATRRKGKWSGGTPLLGYDLDPRGGRLLVNEDEAHARARHLRLVPGAPVAVAGGAGVGTSRLGWQVLADTQGPHTRRPTLHQDQLVSPADQRRLRRQGALQGRSPRRRTTGPDRRRHLRPRAGAVALPRPGARSSQHCIASPPCSRVCCVACPATAP